MGRFGHITGRKTLIYSKVEYQFTWIITDFREVYRGIGYSNDSPHFWTGQNNRYKWALDIYSSGCDAVSKDYVSVRLFLYNKERFKDIKFTLELSVLDEKSNKHSIKRLFLTEETVNTPNGIVKDLILKSTLWNTPKLLPNGELRILCEMCFDDYIDRGIDPELVAIQRSHDTQVTNYFSKLLNNSTFSDFTFVVGDHQFHVHRAILSARSRVFEKMFTSDMSESRCGKTTIKDIDVDVMEKLLHFVYVGQIDDMSELMAQELLLAADKYELRALKRTCEETLVQRLDIENVYDILLLADMHHSPKITRKAIEFLRTNAEQLVVAETFKSNISSLPKALQTEIICTFMTYF